MYELVGVGFFSKVEMRGDRVLEEMDEQVSEQNEKSRIGAAQLNAGRNHLDQRRRQHETCAERDKISEIRPLPIPLNDDGAAENVRARRGQPQQHTGQDGGHEEEGYQERSYGPGASSHEPRTESLPGAEGPFPMASR